MYNVGHSKYSINPSYSHFDLPFQSNQTFMLTQGYDGNFSHKNMFATDWATPVGTPIYSMKSGVVIMLEENYTESGLDDYYLYRSNYLMIQHSDGSIARYSHLDYGGVSVEVGDNIAKGQLIAYTGNTGYSTGPHLHLEIYEHESPTNIKSIETEFYLMNDLGERKYINGHDLEVGAFYTGQIDSFLRKAPDLNLEVVLEENTALITTNSFNSYIIENFLAVEQMSEDLGISFNDAWKIYIRDNPPPSKFCENPFNFQRSREVGDKIEWELKTTEGELTTMIKYIIEKVGEENFYGDKLSVYKRNEITNNIWDLPEEKTKFNYYNNGIFYKESSELESYYEDLYAITLIGGIPTEDFLEIGQEWTIINESQEYEEEFNLYMKFRNVHEFRLSGLRTITTLWGPLVSIEIQVAKTRTLP